MDDIRGLPPMDNHLRLGPQPTLQEPETRTVRPPVDKSSASAPKALTMNPSLKRLSQTLLRGAGQGSSTKQFLGHSLSPRKTVEDALRSTYGRGAVQRFKRPKGRDLYKAISDHRGPVIVLGVSGSPEFIFERDGEGWRGYYAFDGNALEPGVGPQDKVANLFNSHHGLTFSLFTVSGWRKDAHLTEPEDAWVLQPHRSAGGDWPRPADGRREGHDVEDSDDDADIDRSHAHRGTISTSARLLRRQPRFDVDLLDGDAAHGAHGYGHRREDDDESVDFHPGDVSLSDHRSVSDDGREIEQEREQEQEQHAPIDASATDEFVSPTDTPPASF